MIKHTDFLKMINKKAPKYITFVRIDSINSRLKSKLSVKSSYDYIGRNSFTNIRNSQSSMHINRRWIRILFENNKWFIERNVSLNNLAYVLNPGIITKNYKKMEICNGDIFVFPSEHNEIHDIKEIVNKGEYFKLIKYKIIID